MTLTNTAQVRNSTRSVPHPIRLPLALAAIAMLTLAAAALLAPAGADAASKKRIIALTPFSANVLVEFGITPVAVGQVPVGASDAKNAYHKKILNGVKNGKIKQLPLSHGNQGPNKEQVAKLKASIMFSEHTWRASNRYFIDVAKMKVAEHDPKNVGAMAKKVQAMGNFLKVPQKRINKVKKRLNKKIKSTSTSKRKLRSKNGGPKKPKVLILLGFTNQSYLAFLDGSWGNDVVKRAGGKNIAGNLEKSSNPIMFSGKFAHIQPELILAKDPDVIIVVPHGSPDQIPQIKAAVESDQVLAGTNAVQNNNLCFSTDNSLLQPSTMVHKRIKTLRKLKNCLNNW